MRRLNIKFLICLLVPIVLVCAGVHLLWAINVDRSTSLVLEKAETALKRGEVKSALKYYTEYFNRNPDDKENICEAAVLAADLAEKEDTSVKDIRFAYQLMERALRKAPERHDIRRRLIDLLVKVGGFNEARTQIDMLAEADQEISEDLDYVYALCSLKAGEDAAAIERLEKLIGFRSSSGAFVRSEARAPEMEKAYALLAEILQVRRDDYRKADQVIEQMVSANPQSSLALLTRGRYLRQHNKVGSEKEREARKERARDDLRAALNLDPNDVEILLENAVLSIEEEDYASAQSFLETALKDHPKDQRVYIQMARLASVQKDYSTAVTRYEQGLEKISDSPALVLLLFEAQLQTKDIESARATIDRMRKLNFRPVRIALAEAQIPIVEQRWKEASTRLEKIRPEMTQIGSLAKMIDLLLGQCYERLNQPDRQLEAFTRVLAIDSDSIPAMRGQASAMLRMGKYEDALKALQALSKVMTPEKFEKDLTLFRSYYQVVDALGRKHPKNSWYRRETERIKGQLSQSSTTSDIDEVLLSADERIRGDDLASAKSILANGLRENPQDVRLQRGYLRVVIRLDGPEGGLKLLEAAQSAPGERRWPDIVYYRLIRAELLAQTRRPNVKAEIAKLEQNLGDFSDREQAELWRGIGAAYYNIQPRSYEDVRRCWNRSATIAGAPNPQILEMLFDLARETNDESKMNEILDRSEKYAGRDSPLWQYMKAKQIVWAVRTGAQDAAVLQEADRLVEQAKFTRPDWNQLVLLEGEINDLSGNTDRAIELYQESLDLGRPKAATVRRLVELLMRSGRHNEASKAMNLLAQTPEGMQRHKAVLEAMSGRDSDAMAALADAVPKDSTNSEDFLWKGQLLSRLKKSREAEAAFRRAVELNPYNPQVWLVLVENLSRAGKTAEAERVIRQAENRLSEAQAPVVMAQAYAMLGSTPMAEHYYQQALAADTENTGLKRNIATFYVNSRQPAKAIYYLNSILRQKAEAGQSQDPEAVWARRTMASVLSNQRDYASFRKAMGLLEANQSNGVLNVADQRLKAQLLAKRTEPAFRRKAMEMLEELNSATELSDDERLTLAQLYYQTGRWSDTQQIMSRLVTDNSENPRLLQLFASMLLDRNEVGQARTWIEKLEVISPKSIATIRLAARLAIDSGEPEQAIARIKSVLPRPFKPSDAQQLIVAAGLLEELELDETAENAYRQLAKIRPGTELLLAAYLARRGNLDETFAICKGAVSKANIGDIVQIAVGGLSRHPEKATDELKQQASDWIAFAIREFPDSVGLKIQEASALDLQGRHAESETILNELLSQELPDEQRGMLANNLAFTHIQRGVVSDRTLQLVDEAVALSGPKPELLDTRAMVHYSLGNCRKAMRDLQEATLFDSKSPMYYYHLALVHQCNENKSAARRSLFTATDDKGLKADRLSGVDRTRYDALKKWLNE